MDITPLIDVVFLLLLFFMLTSSFVDRQVLELDLPESRHASEPGDSKLLRVQLVPGGTLLFENQSVSVDALARLVERASPSAVQADSKRAAVILQADLGCSIQEMVTAMDQLRDAGASRVQLMTEAGL